ncbi:hypothetical protein GGS24DRAFT_507372 [Hypoxylon argillaceum]|nr:hypothetical protein GGS24DRAFT_507372 [Hypoxylon argillaceum]
MADREGIKKWTEEEKTRFLVQAVKQMQASGGKLSFAKMDLPGRTPKALTHLWAKLSKDYDGPGGDGDGDEADGAVTPSTPASKRGKATPGSSKRTANAAAIGEGGDGEDPPTPSVKRQRKPAAPKGKAKAAAAAVNEDEGVKSDTE